MIKQAAKVHEKITDIMEKRNETADKNGAEPEVEIGDWVFKRIMERTKTDPLFEGPYRIAEISNCRAKLEGQKKSKGSEWTHIRSLRKYKGDSKNLELGIGISESRDKK